MLKLQAHINHSEHQLNIEEATVRFSLARKELSDASKSCFESCFWTAVTVNAQQGKYVEHLDKISSIYFSAYTFQLNSASKQEKYTISINY